MIQSWKRNDLTNYNAMANPNIVIEPHALHILLYLVDAIFTISFRSAPLFLFCSNELRRAPDTICEITDQCL